MIEEEILAEIRSLLLKRWENYTFQYTHIDKEELIRKMKKAFKKITFKPPRELWE